jgi:hypothetical protein
MKGNYRERNRSFYKSFLHERGLRRTNRRAIRAFANIPSYLRRKKNQLLHAAFFLHKEKIGIIVFWSQFFESRVADPYSFYTNPDPEFPKKC